jgi:hypothetical protein
LAATGNYTVGTFNAGTLTVTPAPLTIAADNQSKVYGAPLPTLTFWCTGWVNDDTAASLTTQPELTTTATAASGVSGGPYPITAAGAMDPDYTINYVAGSLTVTPATPAIKWPAPAPIICGTPLSSTQLDASASSALGTVAGTFVYTPTAGSVLAVGAHTLSTTFTPSDAVDYTTATATVTIVVNGVLPVVAGINPKSGPTLGGTAVTITGKNLANATCVMFGGVQVTTFTSDTATQIVLVSPPHAAGTVDVTVVTAAGTSAISKADKYTYLLPVFSAAGTFSITAHVCGLTSPSYLIGGSIICGSTVTLDSLAGGVESGTFDFLGKLTVKEKIGTSTIVVLSNQSFEFQGTFTENVTTQQVTATLTQIVSPAGADAFLSLLGGSAAATGTTNTTSVTGKQTLALNTLLPDAFADYTVDSFKAKLTLTPKTH